MAKILRNIVINYIHDVQLARYATRYLKGRLIDIGCGIKPYRTMLTPYVTEHLGVDHPGTLHDRSCIDMYGTAYCIPTTSESFDSAICTAVLEHLEEPAEAIRECYRLLRPGGIAIYSAPFFWHLHEEPRDFFRYTRFGLQYLFEKAGFSIIEITPLSGFWITFGQAFIYYLYRFNRGLLHKTHLIDILGLQIQSVAYILDRIDRADRWSWMYMAVVQKPL